MLIAFRLLLIAFFIVLEGPDGSGTTTHSKLLADRFKSDGKDVALTAEPSDGPIGRMIRDQLKQDQIPSGAAIQLMFCADRAWHIEHVIQPALKAGKIVVCDRYIPSTLIYGQALNLPLQWLKDLNKIFIQPTITFFLLPGVDVCLQRINNRSHHIDAFEKEAFQRKVYGLYEEMAKDNSISVIDSSKKMEKVAQSIASLCDAH